MTVNASTLPSDRAPASGPASLAQLRTLFTRARGRRFVRRTLRAREAVELLDIEVGRLQELVEDLLELGRADAGVADLSLEQVDVTEFITRVLEANHLDVPVTHLRAPISSDAAPHIPIEARVEASP